MGTKGQLIVYQGKAGGGGKGKLFPFLGPLPKDIQIELYPILQVFDSYSILNASKRGLRAHQKVWRQVRGAKVQFEG